MSWPGFCGQLRCGWRILDPGDCRGEGGRRAAAGVCGDELQTWGGRSRTRSTSSYSSMRGLRRPMRAPIGRCAAGRSTDWGVERSRR